MVNTTIPNDMFPYNFGDDYIKKMLKVQGVPVGEVVYHVFKYMIMAARFNGVLDLTNCLERLGKLITATAKSSGSVKGWNALVRALGYRVRIKKDGRYSTFTQNDEKMKRILSTSFSVVPIDKDNYIRWREQSKNSVRSHIPKDDIYPLMNSWCKYLYNYELGRNFNAANLVNRLCMRLSKEIIEVSGQFDEFNTPSPRRGKRDRSVNASVIDISDNNNRNTKKGKYNA